MNQIQVIARWFGSETDCKVLRYANHQAKTTVNVIPSADSTYNIIRRIINQSNIILGGSLSNDQNEQKSESFESI